MPACCVPYCSNRTEKGIRLFMLPQGDRNKERREAWIKNINRDDLSSRAQICEVHFTSDQFENHREDGRRTLKNNAMPTLFSEQKPPQFNEDNAKGRRRSTRKRKPIVFEEYQSGDEDLESNCIKKEIKPEESSDDKIAEHMQQIELIRCRTCLTIAPKNFSHALIKLVLGKTIKQVIILCVPQMELHDDEYICDKCYRFLLKILLFIDNCLESEEQLRTGKISLDVASNDLGDINQTINLPKKKGRPRKYPILIKEDDKDYEPIDLLDKIPRKRGPKRKTDYQTDKEQHNMEKEEEHLEGLKWGIPISEGKPFTVRKYGKSKALNDNNENKKDSFTVTVSPICDSNNDINDKSKKELNMSGSGTNSKLNGSSDESNKQLDCPCNESNSELDIAGVKSNNFSFSDENIEIHDETEMFVDHKENNVIHEAVQQSILVDFMIEDMSPKENETNSKIVHNDHSYAPENLIQLLRCPQCITDYRTLRGIKLHLTSTHKIAEEQSFKCSFCNMQFFRYNDLIKHKSTHGYACELCEDFFPTATELNSHISLHPERYYCMKCGEKFHKKDLLDKHEPLHERMSKILALIKNTTKPMLQCPHCSLTCGYINTLQQHINSVHLKIKEFECSLCQKKFGASNSLKVHVRVCHSTETPYVCEECGVGYGRLDYLQRHEKTHSIKHNTFMVLAKRNYSKVAAKDNGLSCIFCAIKMSSKQELIAHLQTHNGLKKFECEYCELILNSPSEKHFHESTHKNSYICTTCSKNFSTKKELRIHEDLKECMLQKFTCIICNSTHARQSLLETHILNEHVNKILIDKANSEIGQINVNRKNIEMEWSTDEEEVTEKTEENALNNKTNQNTNVDELNLEHTKEEGYILGVDEDSAMEKSIEIVDYHTKKAAQEKNEECQNDVNSKQVLNRDQELELEEETLCIILIDQKSEQIGLKVENRNKEIGQENQNLEIDYGTDNESKEHEQIEK
ncbi:zinc finger and BTB domain-containing protein 41-like isoform X1 [Diorhabda carinulata]|uniref:zinc finger and BTB domain-containing protein 41-like isoform X1 n=2 Tax=Diorhabda carinulata TaxID=1163345 RepID=UPI0025A22253|nr:zinc finger and BTB domain-containing protein 41-like isoform X1 [Diorhabda carinulata]